MSETLLNLTEALLIKRSKPDFRVQMDFVTLIAKFRPPLNYVIAPVEQNSHTFLTYTLFDQFVDQLLPTFLTQA